MRPTHTVKAGQSEEDTKTTSPAGVTIVQMSPNSLPQKVSSYEELIVPHNALGSISMLSLSVVG